MRHPFKLILILLLILFILPSLIQSEQLQYTEYKRPLDLGKKWCDIQTRWLPLYNRLGPKKVCIGKEFIVRVVFKNTGKAKCGSFKVSLKRGLRKREQGRISNDNTPDKLFVPFLNIGKIRTVKILNPGETIRIEWKDKIKKLGDYRYKLVFQPSPDKNYKNHNSGFTMESYICVKVRSK